MASSGRMPDFLVPVHRPLSMRHRILQSQRPAIQETATSTPICNTEITRGISMSTGHRSKIGIAELGSVVELVTSCLTLLSGGIQEPGGAGGWNERRKMTIEQ